MKTKPMPAPEWVPRISPSHLVPGKLGIVVFGPGEGEAIVVVLPDGSVGVVDGCREPRNDDGDGDPVRELLRELESLHPGFMIEFACLTHPHDDHYGGWGRLLSAYESRVKSVWTVAPVSGRYQKLLLPHVESMRATGMASKAGSLPDDDRVKGLERVLAQVDGFCRTSPSGYQLLQAGQSLLKRRILGHVLRLEAWGPAPKDIQDAIYDLAEATKVLAEGGEPRRHDPNLTSGALAIFWGRAGVLLAGDLLRGNAQRVGWGAAMPHVRRVQVVNAAHHASEEAHDDELWRRMAPDLAIVTPFRHASGDMPPRPDRIATLAAACTVVITAPPAWPRSSKHPRPSGSKATKPHAARGGSRKISMHPAPADPSRHAVAVSLDERGNILRLVLAEGADIYA